MALSDNVQLALIAMVPLILVPAITLWAANWNLHRAKVIENEATERAKRLDAELRKAEKDEDAARKHREREEDRAAAKELLDNTAKTAQAAVATSAKLEEVHVLVNSNYTAALEATYEALQAKMVILLESVAFQKSHGTEPAQETLIDVEATKRRIASLRVTIDERLRRDEMAVELKKNGPSLLVADVKKPVSVADARTAVATERTAAASERVASAAERSADLVEKNGKAEDKSR